MLYYVVSETPDEVCFTLLSTTEDVAEEWAEDISKYSDGDAFADVRHTTEPFEIKNGDKVSILVCADDDEIGIYHTEEEADQAARADGLSDWKIVDYIVGSMQPHYVMFPLR